jgi:hypoxanthine phosphoribosyltransferase
VSGQQLAASTSSFFDTIPASPMPTNMKVLISRTQIAEGVARIGQEITRDFAGESVILVGVLKGACLFLSDLARQIELDATFDFIAVRSYGTQKESAGEVQLIKDVTTPLEDKNVILVEDILDTGLTFSFLRKLLMARKPRKLKFAALLDKPSRRQMPVQADYVGFKIPDEFVVGYGLDYAERFRNLPDICVFSESSNSEDALK